MTDQLISIINTVGLHNIGSIEVGTLDGEVKRLLVLVKDVDDVMRAADGQQCAFERFAGQYHRYKLSVEIGDVVVYTYIK